MSNFDGSPKKTGWVLSLATQRYRDVARKPQQGRVASFKFGNCLDGTALSVVARNYFPVLGATLFGVILSLSINCCTGFFKFASAGRIG